MASYYTPPALPPVNIYKRTYPASTGRRGGSDTVPEESLTVPGSWFLKDVTVYPSRVLSKRSYGMICLGEWFGCPVAVTKFHEMFFNTPATEEEKRSVLKAFAHEVSNLVELKHPNVASFYGVYDYSGHGELSLISDTCLIQELLWLSLNSRNRQNPRFTYRNVIDLSIGIAGGLRYLHERSEPIIHQDLASKNILLSHSGVPKITDLGMAKIVGSTQHQFLENSCHPDTELYMAPEIKMKGASPLIDYRADIYSLGVIILEISIGRDPTATESFRAGNELQIVPETERRQYDLQDLVDSPLYYLVLACLTRVEDRPDTLRVHEKLRELKTELAYTSLPDTPIVQQSSGSDKHNCQCTELEEKVRKLQEEKEISCSQEENSATSYEQSTDIIQNQDKIRHLEATVRSRDSEIASLRDRNISLEEKLGKVTGEGCFPVKLTSRGEFESQSNQLTSEPDLTSELKMVRKQLERYKDLTVELDSKLKDAKLELSKYAHRQTGYDIHGQLELNSARSENRILRTEIERLRREAAHYHQQQLGSSYRCYNPRY